jgi:nucleoside-diphosphate-sugar epimerase
MNVLIIGGTGLISSPMTRLFVERGETVTRYNRGKLALYPAPAEVHQLHGDRTDYAAFEQQMREAGVFDVVIDMIGYLPEDGESVVRAFGGRTGHFIFCSTVDVYQKPATRYPITEAEPYGGLNAYSTNKIKIEKTLLAAHERGDFPVTIIRPAYTYGEGRGPIHSLGGRTSYLDRIRKGKPIVVHGDGSSFWTACYRDDVARAFVEAAGRSYTFGRSYHTPGEDWMTWNLYHQRVAQAMGAPAPELIHIPTDILAKVAPTRARVVPENFQFNNIFDSSAARADLAFQPTLSWVEGVQRMVSWLDANKRMENSDDDPFEDRLIAAWRQAGVGLVQNLEASGGIG